MAQGMNYASNPRKEAERKSHEGYALAEIGEGAITSTIRRLAEQEKVLYEAIAALEARINPILTPDHNEVAEGHLGGFDSAPDISPMAEMLVAVSDGIDRKIRTLRTIMDRVQI